MTASGLEGAAQASTFGENNGTCGYSAMAVDYVFTLQVGNLEASADLASAASSVLDIATRFVKASPAPNLGKLQLIFQADGQQCQWFYQEGAWNAGGAGMDNFIACPVPVSGESQWLADMLNALSVDLGCQTTSRVTANTQQAVLECERPEGGNRYLLTVTLRLNGHGYEGACFHGYKAFESSMTGENPMTVNEYGVSYFERDRSFEWMASGVLYQLFERIKGGPDVTLPADTREQVYLRAVQAGLIPSEGSDCR